ncbi:glycosyltransferase [Reyranella sp.]|uniref:glycosyltransferase family 4 protein n=1 Tax=Reyranella sp. TaxID=1929291 RepID=UPI003C7B011C
MATELYRRALESDDAQPDIWVQYGHALKESGSHAEAELAYRKAIALAPRQSDTHLQLGHLLKICGQRAAAIAAYEMALNLDAGNKHAANELHALGESRRAETIIASQTETVIEDGAMLFDVSDLVFYLGHHDNLTGIQRVQASILLSLPTLVDLRKVEFVAFDRTVKGFRCLDKRRFLALLEQLPHPAERRTIMFDREAAQRGRLFSEGLLHRALSGRPSASLVLLGAAWVLPDYPSMVVNLKREHGLRFLMLFHDLIPIYARETCDQGTANVFKLFLDSIIPHVDVALCVSDNTAKDLRRYCDQTGRAPPPTVVTRNGTLLPMMTGQTEQLRTARMDLLLQRPFVLFVSTIEGRKNHLFAFRLWERMLRSGLDVPALLCVGRLGWRAEEFLQFCVDSDFLGGRILLVQDVSDVELVTLYRECLFTLYPSLYEGWGLPVGESLSSGRICVLSDRSSLPEVAGSLGVYLNIDDLEASVNTVSDLIGDPGRRQELELKIAREYRPVTWQGVGEAVIDACHKAARVSSKRVVPLWQFGTEYIFRALEDPPEGVMGQAMMDHILASRAHSLTSGYAKRDTQYAALDARDDGWFTPESWGCWTRNGGGALTIGLPRMRLDESEHLLIYASIQLPGYARLPARVGLLIGDGFMETRKIETNHKVVAWKVPIRLVQPSDAGAPEETVVKLTFTSQIEREVREESGQEMRDLGIGIKSLIVVPDGDIETRLRIMDHLIDLAPTVTTPKAGAWGYNLDPSSTGTT